MKAIKDKFISDHLYYLVLAYLHETRFQPVRDMGMTRQNERGREEFCTEWLDFEQFSKLAKDAIDHFMGQSKDMTLENIDLYAEK